MTELKLGRILRLDIEGNKIKRVDFSDSMNLGDLVYIEDYTERIGAGLYEKHTDVEYGDEILTNADIYNESISLGKLLKKAMNNLSVREFKKMGERLLRDENFISDFCDSYFGRVFEEGDITEKQCEAIFEDDKKREIIAKEVFSREKVKEWYEDYMEDYRKCMGEEYGDTFSEVAMCLNTGDVLDDIQHEMEKVFVRHGWVR